MSYASQESVDEKVGKLLQLLEDGNDLGFKEISNLLAELRILTREKTFSQELLHKCTGLLIPYVSNGHVEAQKCLSNLIMNYDCIRDSLVDPLVSSTESRLRTVLEDKPEEQTETFQSNEHKYQLLYHDLRIIFLLSAMCASSRDSISSRLSYLITRLLDVEAGHLEPDYELINEGLKILFNLTLKSENVGRDYKVTNGMIRKLLDVSHVEGLYGDAIKDENPESQDKLLVNLIHLLTNMPEEVYIELSENDKDRILNHLRMQLTSCPKHGFRDHVLPVLNVCLNICRYSEETRKKWFEQILQSTQGFELRPEEYEDFRGNLVKLMTSVDVHIKDLAADFLYSLCNGDTEKFITYTGFGNSAAYLSSRGLLSKRSDNKNTSIVDTEYQDLRDRLNPITGRIETTKRNPMEGMSEEEKEYHAEELANAITKLTNLGLMKPMRVGDDKTLSDIHPSSLNRSQKD